jgi:hypothetical protein
VLNIPITRAAEVAAVYGRRKKEQKWNEILKILKILSLRRLGLLIKFARQIIQLIV